MHAIQLVGPRVRAGWRRLSVLVVAAVGCWVLSGRPAQAAGMVAPAGRMVTAYVVLQGPPVALVAERAVMPLAQGGKVAAARDRAAQIQAQQTVLAPQLVSHGASVQGRLSRLVNAVRVRVPAARLGELELLPGVASVRLARRHALNLQTSVPFVGAPAVWRRLVAGTVHADGTGIRVGIIDSGIDYTHADFGGSGRVEDFKSNDPTRIEPGSFPSAKVVGGYDFAGDDYNPSDEDHAVPAPDPDPLDCYANGHGTHVAGIAAGYGMLVNGVTYTGSYSGTLDSRQFAIGPGVAPRASLYALKVFGCGGSTDLVVEALEWAADPNGDFDFSDRLDVVNLSLGDSFAPLNGEDPEQLAINRLSELGCVVVVSAGNAGNTFYVGGSPAQTERAITVANSLHDGLFDTAIEVTAPGIVAGLYACLEGVFTKPLALAGLVSGKLVYVEPALACEDLANAAALSGNIALIDRGTCFFVDKIRRAQQAGAIAVVMVNKEDGPPIVMGGDAPDINIPGVMISKADGALIKRSLSEGVTVKLGPELFIIHPEWADRLEESSSRGPGSPSNYLKPDLSAPGVQISSASSGEGIAAISYTGTSMSSPHVAGAAALLRQLHPTWPTEDIKAALMNTALATHDAAGNPYPESRTGAGRVRVDVAARTELTAAAENAEGRVSLSFGSLVLAAPHRETRTIRLTNHGETNLVCTVVVSNTIAQPGIALALTATNLTVPAQGSATVGLELRADPSQFRPVTDPTTADTIDGEARQFLYEASGQVWFQNPAQPIHLPYYLAFRPAADFAAVTNRVEFGANAGSTSALEVPIPIRGVTVHTNPVVSAFQLGATSTDRHYSNPLRAASDLLAVGAASDIARPEARTDLTLYFGIATAGPWTTPQLIVVELTVKIDVDGDGTEDYKLSNGDLGNGSGDATDVLKSYVETESSKEVVETGYLNVFPADQLDTAPFNNSVAVLSAPASAFGLGPSKTRFRYKVMTSSTGTLQDDETPWITFDAAHPAVDTAAFGLEGTPLHEDGRAVQVRLDRAAAADAGLRLPGVLLLHHHNRDTNRFEIVRLDLSHDDSDFDGVPDWWEMQQFGNLTTAGATTDSDGDGFSDSAEFRAGTDPKDPKSFLHLTSARGVSSGVELKWASITGKYYALERSTNLVDGTWDTIQKGLQATAPLNVFTNTDVSASEPAFYRVRMD